MDKETAIELFQAALESLERVTVWAATLVIGVYLTAFHSSGPVKGLGVELSRKEAGLLLFALLCGVLLRMVQQLYTLRRILSEVPAAKESINARIRYHPWLFNPFTDGAGPYSLLDSVGTVLLMSLWFLGARAGLRFIHEGRAPDEVGFPLFLAYVFLAVWIGNIVGGLFRELGFSQSQIRTRQIVAMVVVVIALVWFSL